MADIVIGKALWTDLARQIAVHTRDHYNAEGFLRWIVSADIRHRPHSITFKSAAITRQLEAFHGLKMKVPANAAFKATKTVWGSVGALPAIAR